MSSVSACSTQLCNRWSGLRSADQRGDSAGRLGELWRDAADRDRFRDVQGTAAGAAAAVGRLVADAVAQQVSLHQHRRHPDHFRSAAYILYKGDARAPARAFYPAGGLQLGHRDSGPAARRRRTVACVKMTVDKPFMYGVRRRHRAGAAYRVCREARGAGELRWAVQEEFHAGR